MSELIDNIQNAASDTYNTVGDATSAIGDMTSSGIDTITDVAGVAGGLVGDIASMLNERMQAQFSLEQ